MQQKVTVSENITFGGFVSRIRSLDCSKLAKNPENDNDVTVSRHDVNVKFFRVVLFLLLSLVTGPSFMSISSLVLDLWQFLFYKGLTRNPEIPPSEFCPISGEWSKLWMPNLAWMSLIECNWMLQNSRVTACTVFELLRDIQLGRGLKLPPPPFPRLGLIYNDNSFIDVHSQNEYDPWRYVNV